MACAVALRVTPASAQPAPLPTLVEGEGRPWAAGVSDDEQAVARDLYTAGNADFIERNYVQALAKYKDAILHWDHPAIRFNIAVCLINLDRRVDAMDNLGRSLAYGDAPLGNEIYAQGLTYRKLLEAQLARVKAACPEAGAVVTLDGKYLFTAPGDADQLVLAGEHQLAATKTGFRTALVTFSAMAGKEVVYRLQPSPDLGPLPPYWRYWKYLVAGGGALSAVGAAAYFSARSDIEDADLIVQKQCATGCKADQVNALTGRRAKLDSAGTKQAAAFSLWSIGGAAVVVGVLGLILDQPRVAPESSRVVPVIGLAPGGASASVGWVF